MSWWNVLEPIWSTQEGSEDPKVFLAWFDGLSKHQKILFPTHWLCAEVYNGGFHQYFSNPTGLHAPEAIVGFNELDLNDIADIVERAMSIFGEEFPRERHKREAILIAIEENATSEWTPFSELDDQFYEAIKIPGATDLFEDDRFTAAATGLIKRSE